MKIGNQVVLFINPVFFFVNNDVWISIRVKQKIKKNKHWANQMGLDKKCRI